MGADPSESTQPTLLHRLNQEPSDSLTWGRFEAAYGPVVRGWCGHWGLDGPGADEVTRSVLLRLTAKLPAFRYDARGTFRAWLRTLTQHAWHDLVSDSGFRARVADDGSAHRNLDSVAARDDLAARVEAAFERELLNAALARVRTRVPDDTWEAFRLTVLDGLPAADAADRLGTRPSRVYLAKRRVLRLVRELTGTLDGPDTRAG